MVNKKQVSAGRKAVEAYRTAHSQLHAGGWYKGISDDHTPLLNTMLAEFKRQGFNSLDEFFDTSELLNVQEFGFTSKLDMTDAELLILDGKWK
ncbi:hypothetical protein LCGC14_1222340 [marine sediment metagenome]|uniref:Uncharacterized protein n=1 Tax=marine sediment metagenome TaxID=412755 RepID=A0A0F9LY20_9ZZZZ